MDLTTEELQLVSELFAAAYEKDMRALRERNAWLREEINRQEAALKYRFHLSDDQARQGT